MAELSQAIVPIRGRGSAAACVCPFHFDRWRNSGLRQSNSDTALLEELRKRRRRIRWIKTRLRNPTGTGREDHIVVTENLRVERRKEHRDMHVDRRKTAIDVIEHV